MNICIIPARGGSKRIPRKNIKLFHGKPMIAWSIQAAIESECFDRIIVSTDDDEIATISEQYGAEIPFKRPDELSDDYSSTVDVMYHAATWVRSAHDCCRYLCCLYPTAPLMRIIDLKEGLRAIERNSLDYVYSVVEFDFPIQRAIKVTEQGVFAADEDGFEKRSQDLEPMWHDAGQFYWGSIESFLDMKPLVGSKIGAIRVPALHCQDIDNESDWELAELKKSILLTKQIQTDL